MLNVNQMTLIKSVLQVEVVCANQVTMQEDQAHVYSVRDLFPLCYFRDFIVYQQSKTDLIWF